MAKWVTGIATAIMSASFIGFVQHNPIGDEGIALKNGESSNDNQSEEVFQFSNEEQDEDVHGFDEDRQGHNREEFRTNQGQDFQGMQPSGRRTRQS